jgi:hypothetical protein
LIVAIAASFPYGNEWFCNDEWAVVM